MVENTASVPAATESTASAADSAPEKEKEKTHNTGFEMAMQANFFDDAMEEDPSKLKP